MAYLDNIIIYLDIKKEYEEHVEWVLKKLYDKNIPITIEKCKFYIKKTDFIGFIIELKQINMNLKKVKAIVSRQDLENVIKLRLFLGFCNYYKRFIKKESDKTEPFTKMIKKDEPWKWDDDKKRLFKEVKEKFMKKPILRIYQLRLLIKVKINALDFALGACLLQKHDGIWHLVAYYSRKMTPLELNYDIYDKELLGIITAFKEWRVFLQGTIEPFTVKIDHKNLTGFLITKELNRQQVKWAEMLSEYHFEIEHVKGLNNAKAD